MICVLSACVIPLTGSLSGLPAIADQPAETETISAEAVDTIADVNAPDISARAAVLISADTGEVIFSRDSGDVLSMASTTKIMTVLLTLESAQKNDDLYEWFTVDSQAIRVEGSSMGLTEGDSVTKYALCCGMLLPSGNDAANAAAVRIAGNTGDFADMMNRRAEDIGMKSTHFVTPSGLEGNDGGAAHSSTAYDMALLAREALRNDTFREICSQQTIETEFGSPPYKRWLKNTNRLLSMYDGVYGVKTGFTDEAGRCLVSACERDGLDLICVTLGDPDDWNDHMALYDYGFRTAHRLTVTLPERYELPFAGGERDTITVSPAEDTLDLTVFSAAEGDLSFSAAAPPFVYAPVSEGEEIAWLRVYLRSEEIMRIPLLAAEDCGGQDI
ncbi:MAG: D-alanyl-D-alanine carboxypeptidase [Ruminococcus sp.]|nr:D-alanyl-D-alanine carboxypeptidase [Ruminococcus sp.]